MMNGYLNSDDDENHRWSPDCFGLTRCVSVAQVTMMPHGQHASHNDTVANVSCHGQGRNGFAVVLPHIRCGLIS